MVLKAWEKELKGNHKISIFFSNCVKTFNKITESSQVSYQGSGEHIDF